MFQFKVEGMNRIKNAFRKLAAADRTIFEPETKKWANQTQKTLLAQKYPPKRPNQKYRRTGKLGSAWHVKQSGPGKWAITNQANRGGKYYAAYVVGNNQAWMHAGRWWKASDVIEKRMPALTQAINQKIERTFVNG